MLGAFPPFLVRVFMKAYKGCEFVFAVLEREYGKGISTVIIGTLGTIAYLNALSNLRDPLLNFYSCYVWLAWCCTAMFIGARK